MRNLITLFLLLSLLLAGCGSPASPAPTSANPAALSTPKPSGSSAQPSLALKPCTVAGAAIQAECGFLHVPEDRSNPGGRTLNLWTVVVRARDPNPEPDPLFYIVGGPGAYATHDSVVASTRTFLDEVNAKRDIVFMDQRGTADSHRLACEPMPAEVTSGTQQQINDWMKGCLASLDGDPRFLTTAVAMRDLDAARAALGYEKINLYGISYGVIAAQVYMRMFPERVRTAVLDHGTALDLPWFYARPQASQAALEQVFSYCEQDVPCHAAYPDIRADWQVVRGRLAKGPVVTSWIPPGMTAPDQVSMVGLAKAIHNLLMGDGAYAVVPGLIHSLAAHEDWTQIVKSFNEQYGAVSSQPERFLLMKNMIFCFEPAWGTDPGEAARLNPNSYYRDNQVMDSQLQQKVCAALPEPDASLIYGPGKPAPLSALIFISLIDPQNPPANMDLALKEFTKSRMVIEPTEGHDSLYITGCRWDLVAQYIQQGSADGLDLSCIGKKKPSFVIGNE